MKTLLLACALPFTSLVGCALSNASETLGTIVSVETQVPGASAEAMEDSVVRPMESALAILDGVGEIRSKASEGRSYFEIYFKTREQAKHLLLVQRAVEAVQPSLPPVALGSVVANLETRSLK